MNREVLRQSISFQLNPDSGVPAYIQLAQQVKQAIRMGVLDVGDKLPTVKEVVAEVAINPNTVMKAYWQLEHEGLVEGRQGVGTFVSRRPSGPPPDTQARLARSLERWVQSARDEGLDDESIESMLRATLSGSRLREQRERARRPGDPHDRVGQALRLQLGTAGLLGLGAAWSCHGVGRAERSGKDDLAQAPRRAVCPECG